MTHEEVLNSKDHDLIVEIYTDLKSLKEDIRGLKESQKTIIEDHQRIDDIEDDLKAHTTKDNLIAGFGSFGILVALILDFIKLKP